MNSNKRPLAWCIASAVLWLAACSGNSESELLAAAKTAAEKKENSVAVIHLKNALQKNPQSAQARLMLGKLLLETGDATAALVELRKAQELQVPDEQVMPLLARAMLLTGEEAKVVAQFAEIELKNAEAQADLKTSLGTAYAGQRDLDRAGAAIAAALRARPNHAPALIVSARLVAAEGDIDRSLQLLDTVLGAEPGNDRAAALKAELLLLARRDIEGAMQTYRTALQANPGSAVVRGGAAQLLLGQNKVDEARTEVEALKKLAPNHPETLLLQSQLAYRDKNYTQVREIGERVLKVLPDNLRMLEMAGAAEYKLKNYMQAEALLARALKLAPGMYATRLMLSQSYMRSGQPGKTLEVLQPVIDSPKADGASLSIAGEAYLLLGDNQRSDEAFKRAVKAAPNDPRVRTSAAVAQLAQGNSATAITDLEAISGAEGSSPRADLALVSARLRQNDVPGALKAIDALEKKLPDQPLPHNLRGRVLLGKQDFAGAAKSFEAALAKDPAFFPAVASLAAIDLNNQKPDTARQRFNAYLKEHPKHAQARLALAELDARTGASAEVVTQGLREAAKFNAGDPQPQLVLINRLMAMGDNKGALAAAQEAAAALPNNFEITSALGRAQLAAGDSQRAVTTFKQLTSQQPRNPTHELRLAEAYAALKDNESATRSLRRVLELQPESVPARRGLATIAMADKRPQDALTLAREMQRTGPKDPAGWLLEGDIEISRQGFEPAAAAYRAALQRNLKLPEAMVKLHTALLAAQKTADADRLAADWLKDNPKDAGFRYYLGDVALSKNDLARAEQQYRQVLELQPEHALALNNVAWLLVKQGKPGALPLAEKANTLLPNRAPLVDTLATVLEAENQLPKAIETQKRAIFLAPKDPTMVLRLAKMYIKAGEKDRARAELESLAQLGTKFGAQAEVSSLMKTL